MAVTILYQIPGLTQDQYDQIIENLQSGGITAQGRIYHVAGPMEGGWQVIDVFESQEAFERFIGGGRDVGPVTVLHANAPGVSGYFNSADQYPRWVFAPSNERPMVYLNVNAVRPGTAGYTHTLTHELTHLFHFYGNLFEDTWLKEGLGELAQQLRAQPQVHVVAQVEGHHGGGGNVGLEEVLPDESGALADAGRRRPLTTVLHEGGVDLHAHATRAEVASGGDDETAIAAAEVVHDVGSGDVREPQHLHRHRFRRGHEEDVGTRSRRPFRAGAQRGHQRGSPDDTDLSPHTGHCSPRSAMSQNRYS